MIRRSMADPAVSRGVPRMPERKPIELVPPKARRFCTCWGTSCRMTAMGQSFWLAGNRAAASSTIALSNMRPGPTSSRIFLKFSYGKGSLWGKLSFFSAHMRSLNLARSARASGTDWGRRVPTSATCRRTRRLIGPLSSLSMSAEVMRSRQATPPRPVGRRRRGPRH